MSVPPEPLRQRTAEHWGQKAHEQAATPAVRAAVNWLESPLVQHGCVNPRISGRAEVNWLEWAVRNHLPRDLRAACTLGCGGGGLERHARWLGVGVPFDAFDISPGAVAVAARQAQEEGLRDLHYRAVDLDAHAFPEGAYDVVFGSMSLHHLHRLDDVLRGVRRALRPGGVLIWNEYIGPKRFQWTLRQLDLCNALLATLPERLRADPRHGGRVKTAHRRPTLAEMDAIDPSEAARSDEIVGWCEELFEPVVRVDYGGTLLHLALDGIVGNFALERPDDVAHLRRLFDFEAACLRSGVLGSDFGVGVYRRG